MVQQRLRPPWPPGREHSVSFRSFLPLLTLKPKARGQRPSLWPGSGADSPDKACLCSRAPSSLGPRPPLLAWAGAGAPLERTWGSLEQLGLPHLLFQGCVSVDSRPAEAHRAAVQTALDSAAAGAVRRSECVFWEPIPGSRCGGWPGKRGVHEGPVVQPVPAQAAGLRPAGESRDSVDAHQVPTPVVTGARPNPHAPACRVHQQGRLCPQRALSREPQAVGGACEPGHCLPSQGRGCGKAQDNEVAFQTFGNLTRDNRFIQNLINQIYCTHRS